ncbi:MAG TPA: hypothetical protein VLU46_06215, partial [Thermoanaerobaculia bacterium]|nr:hypothetical protein [Thermoanaerobaculia bacterium]
MSGTGGAVIRALAGLIRRTYTSEGLNGGSMRRLLSIAVGVLAPFVFIAGASPFEIPGQNSLQEILAGSIAVVVYSAICEFFIGRGHTHTARERWT